MKKRLRILQTNSHRGGWGGQPNRILMKSIELTKRGHFVIIAVPSGSTLSQRAKEQSLPVYDDLAFDRKFKPYEKIEEILKIKNLIETEDIDIVHTHGSQDTWICAVAGRLAKNKPVIIRTRHNIFPIATHFFNRYLYRRIIDRVIAVSDGVTEIFEKNGLLPPQEIKIIPSSVDLDRFSPDDVEARETIRREFNIKENETLIGMVGRFAREKGHRVLLDAAQKIIENRKDVKFILAGEGPLEEELKNEVKEKGIADYVIFAGFRKDIPQFLSALDIFTLTPTAGESLGTAILEAFAMKKPVVAADLGGVHTSVRDGTTGFLFQPGNSEELAIKLSRLIEDKTLRVKFGEAGRRMIEEEFTKEKMAEATEEVYFEEFDKKLKRESAK
ncbi:MAG: glycosyltransferase family 1 protein [Candidatus Schekmanbacteria bacterium]|nr:MAG: glycosyltransferase family 1 protein [Candidatus Schekmanbacteria bacterium]